MPGGFGGFQTQPSKSAEIDASTPFIAAADGDLSLLQTSIKQLGLSPNAVDSNGFTFLHAACGYCRIEVIHWLLGLNKESSSGNIIINVNAPDGDGDTPLHHCDEVDCAKLLIEQLARLTTHRMRTFGALSIEERAKARRDTGYACTLAKRSVERLFDVAGANGLYSDKHFQRYYRDVKAGSNHIAIGWDRCGSTYGRVVLGLEPGLDEI